MALADDIGALRDRALADHNDAYDYYADTKLAWRIVHTVMQVGLKFSIRNTTTGSTTTQVELASKARGYLVEQLAEASFQQSISVFESYFFDLLRLWLLAHPKFLGKKQVDFQSILDAPDKESITLLVVDKELNDVLYLRPAGWFAYLNDRAKLGCPTASEVEQLAEAKATRDVLVHNRGTATKIYESKAGKLARFKEGQRIDVPEQYHRETWELIRKVIVDTSTAAIAKAT